MEYSADGYDLVDSLPPLSMLEVLKQRKRRRRLSIDGQEEDRRVDGEYLFHQRRNEEHGLLRTKLPAPSMDTSFCVAATRASERTRKSSSISLFWSLAASFVCSTFLFGSIQLQSAIAFQPAGHQQIRLSKSSSLFPRFMSLATPTSSIPSKSELESMKVVDLKQLIKDSGHNERGLFSKLKKKQDLVEFLAGKATIPEAATSNTAAATQKQQLPEQKRKIPITMPKKKPATATPADASDTNEYPQQRQSPMAELWERVNAQYPALQYIRDGNRTGYGEFDIRQRYHPMLQAGNLQAIPESELEETNDDDSEESESASKKSFKPALSGDMDLIFVGTASCTPSITRGVSCTALRLHSLASSSSPSNKKQKNMKVTNGQQRFEVEISQSKNLGTWLFDCGESTQVRTISVLILVVVRKSLNTI